MENLNNHSELFKQLGEIFRPAFGLYIIIDESTEQHKYLNSLSSFPAFTPSRTSALKYSFSEALALLHELEEIGLRNLTIGVY